jgi:hypothetical protein
MPNRSRERKRPKLRNAEKPTSEGRIKSLTLPAPIQDMHESVARFAT